MRPLLPARGLTRARASAIILIVDAAALFKERKSRGHLPREGGKRGETMYEKEKSAAAQTVSFDGSRKKVPLLFALAGVLIMLAQWIAGVNLVTLVGVVYLCVCAAMITLSVFVKKRVYVWYMIGYICVSFGIFTFYVIAGADAGWGGFLSATQGWASADHPLWQGEGSALSRLLGNAVILSPSFLLLVGVYAVAAGKGAAKMKNIACRALSLLLVLASVILVFTVNLRARPRVLDMSAGHDEYLSSIKKNAKQNGSPNVLFILMDDMGWADASYNAARSNLTIPYETPNIDSVAENGVSFDNFYANYSVCSPSRFAALTGRYPYRGHADNVLYPSVNTLSPFNSTRVFDPVEMGANCDGMLGDEVTLAEMFSQAGYKTGAFGKWHLGDYGQYLPTNQGFDYFYGSHHINDNTPYYHVREGGTLGAGNYEVAVGADIDQGENTVLIHNEICSWLGDTIDSGEPFFAYYASPWPHAPVHAGADFVGTSGAGIYGDCLTEFDHYLGLLFEMLEEKGVLEDTVIIFTSDNGPALQGSTGDLRGGKYTAYEAGQKVPFFMRWDNAPKEYEKFFTEDNTVYAPAAMADLFPSLAYICNVTDGEKRGFTPADVDRQMDGVSFVPLLKDADDNTFIHGKDSPILHMKREKIVAVQYSLSRERLTELSDNAELPQCGYDYTTWKYFASAPNDNPAFFNLTRKNWLICLTDDPSESYDRMSTFAAVGDDLKQAKATVEKNFAANRRGAYSSYYNA